MFPLITTVPVPLGARSKVALDVVTRSLPLRSKLPPSCGLESSETFEIALDVASPATTALLEIFFKPPPEVSIAKNTSSLATVLISDSEETAVGLKLVPSATRSIPAVLVPITRSSPPIVRSPVNVRFLIPV